MALVSGVLAWQSSLTSAGDAEEHVGVVQGGDGDHSHWGSWSSSERGRNFCSDKLTLENPAQRRTEEAAGKCFSHCPVTSARGRNFNRAGRTLQHVKLEAGFGPLLRAKLFRAGTKPHVPGSRVCTPHQPSHAMKLFPSFLLGCCWEHPRAGHRVPYINRWQQLPGCWWRSLCSEELQ